MYEQTVHLGETTLIKCVVTLNIYKMCNIIK